YSVNDFASVRVIGYAEHGRLEIEVNDATISKIYADGKKDKATALRFAETFSFNYQGKDSEDSYFSNGDVVIVNVAYDESLAKSLGINIVGNSFEYTVQGLEDKAEVSPFEGLSVKFSGVAPYGTVQLDKSNCIQYVIDNVTFYCDAYDLSNGDKIVVSAEFNPEIAERNGYVFTENVKKYTVVGLSKYVSSMTGVDYGETTAVMHRMIEKYVAETEYSFKTLDWRFGDEDSDSDSVGDELLNYGSGVSDIEPQYDEDGNLIESSDTDSELKSKAPNDAEKIKADIPYADFRTSFVYEPLACHYSLNPVQYSDNLFSATYKVTGTFICTAANSASYIKEGDTIVGEIYVIATLAGGSVDIKNVLNYEKTTVNNFYSYSCRSFKTYEDLQDDLLKSTTYLTENLEYVEDKETYDEYPQKQKEAAESKYEVSHVDRDSDSDSDKNESKRENSASASASDSENSDSEQFAESDGNSSIYYGNDDLGEQDYENNYYDDGYYDYGDGNYDNYNDYWE
ncbi:MAG: hypothetical protein K2M82_04775, partial [Lachnospiraceae bacterium]|nr:hypothetical protein [Lachnospiraceae bacterium]